jgi:hypothetical protein
MDGDRILRGAELPENRPLRVLMVGNSYSLSVMKELPEIVAAQDKHALDITNMYIGGCSLERHVENWDRAKREADFRPYRISRFVSGRGRLEEFDGNMPEVLDVPAYDLVTLQQCSHQGFRRESWEPYGDLLAERIRAVMPEVRFAVHQTWSYRSDAEKLKLWGMTQHEMFLRTREVYADRARHFDCGIIPVGEAVERFRKLSETRFVAFDPAALAALTPPLLPPDAGDVVGKYRWKPDAEGKTVLAADVIHLNRFGEYLQACVWFGALFGADPLKISYEPAYVSPEMAALLRRCAAEALAGETGE